MMLQDQWKLFSECLFEPSSDVVEFRCLPAYRDMGIPVSLFQFNEARLIRENQGGYNVYAGINPRNGRSRKECSLARSLFCDFDNTDLQGAAERIDKAGLPVPTLVVWSGSGPHCYWRLTEPLIEFARFTELQKKLIASLGTDKVVHDAPRIMRVPGTFNWRRDQYSWVVHADRAIRHDVALFDKLALPAQPVIAEAEYRVTVRKAQTDRAIRCAQYVAKMPAAVSGCNGHTQTFRAAMVCANAFCLTLDEAWPILLAYNGRCQPPWNEKDLRRKFAQAQQSGRMTAKAGVA